MKTRQIMTDRFGLAGLCLLVFLSWNTAGFGSPATGEQLPPDLSGQDLTLQQAVDLALQYNPALRSYVTAEAVTKAQVAQAGRGPNPELGLEIENFAGSGTYSGFSAAEFTLVLAQTFELGGKRARRQEAIGWQTQMIRLEAELAAREIAARTSQAFITTLAAQTELVLAEELVALTTEDLDFIRRQVAMGAASPVEINRARVAVARAHLAVGTVQGALAAARIRLAALWQSKTPTFAAVRGDLEITGPIPNWPEVNAQLAQSPLLARWDIEASSRLAEIALAEALGKIDLTASAGIRHYGDDGENAVVAAVTIPLPVRNANQDATRAAQLGLAGLDTERHAQFLDLLAALSRQYEKLDNSHSQILTVRDEILPLAEQSMVEMDTAYRKGIFKLTDVLAVRRTWFEVRGAYTANLARYHEAAVEINLLLGGTQVTTLTSKEID